MEEVCKLEYRKMILEGEIGIGIYLFTPTSHKVE